MLTPQERKPAMSKIPPVDGLEQVVDREGLLKVAGASLGSLTEALLSGKTTAKAVGEAHGMSPKQFHKALKRASSAGWQDWTRAMLPLCESRTGLSALIADDTVAGHPSGKVLPFAKVLYHGTLHRPVYSQNLVALAWTDGTRVILLGLRHWEPDAGVTKHQILREMLDEVVDGGLKADWLLFDGWYLNPEMVLWCAEHRIHWASRLRRDRLVETNQGPIDEALQYRVDELAAGFSEREYRWYGGFRKYAKGVEVTTGLWPEPVKVVLVKPRFHASLDDMKFWICSALVDVPTVLRLVRLRWGIEVVFRYLKQRFKLETCIIRTPEILLVWWKLLWNAFNTIADLQDYGRNWASAKIYWLSRRNPHATMYSALGVA